MTQPLKDKIALITGASRGIGAAVAKRFAAEGAHVILTARTVGGLEEVDDAIQAAGGSASLVPLDLRESDKIDSLGAQIYERWGKLDIFVGNAGMLGQLTPLAHTDPKMWDDVFAVNVTANMRLIRTLDPLLRQSEAGRVMFVTSGITQMDAPYWGAYAASKAALEQMVRSYAAEVADTEIKANLVDPGIVQSQMRARAFPGEDASQWPTPEQVTDQFVELACTECVRTGEKANAAA